MLKFKQKCLIKMFIATFLCLNLNAKLSVAEPQISPSHFEKSFIYHRYESTEQSLKQLSAKRTQILNYTYVFVAGFLNEPKGNAYFANQVTQLRKMGVPEEQIYLIQPNSNDTVLVNSSGLYQKISKIQKSTEKNLILIGHSKGAAEIYYLAHQQVDFFDAHVHAAFLIQSALGGSAIADLVVNANLQPQSLAHLPTYDRLFLKFTDDLAGLALKILGTGFVSLTHAASSYRWQYVKQNYPQPPKSVEDKVYYILSSRAPEEMPLHLRPFGYYQQVVGHMHTDGLVAIEDQYDSKFGTPLLRLNADHMELVIGRRTSKRRVAIMNAILENL